MLCSFDQVLLTNDNLFLNFLFIFRSKKISILLINRYTEF